MDDTSGSARVVAALQRLGIEHEIVRTAPASSAEESAAFQGIELRQLVKTILVRKGGGSHVFVLVPGDREIDWKKLRQQLGVSRASLPTREDAERITGFQIGTINPFASGATLPVVLDSSALARSKVALGAGERGVNVHVNPSELASALNASVADVTVPQRRR